MAQEPWEMSFVDYSKLLWGDNWVIGNKRLEAREYHGKTGRQITQNDYHRGKLQWENSVQWAVRVGKPVDPENVKLANIREKQPWEEGYKEQEEEKERQAIEGKTWQEVNIGGIEALAIKPRGGHWRIVEKTTGASLLPPSWPGGMKADTLDGAIQVVLSEVVNKMGVARIRERIAEVRAKQPQPFTVRSKPRVRNARLSR